MAIIYDAPSTDWQTQSVTSVQPIYINQVELTGNAFIYTIAYAVNPAYWATGTISAPMCSTTTTATLGAGGTSVTVADSSDFPQSGLILIFDTGGTNAEYIKYTAVNKTTHTISGMTRGQGEGNKPDPSGDVEHASGETVYFCAWMVDETTPEQLSGGMSTFQRRFAMVPDSWIDYEMRAYTFPGYYDSTSFGNFRGPLSRVCLWSITNYYEHAPGDWRGDVTDIDVPAQAFTPVDDDGVVLGYVDDNSTPTYTTYAGYVSGSTSITVSDSTFSRYEGLIFKTQKFEAVAQ